LSIAKVQGNYDIAAFFLVKNLLELFTIWQNTFKKNLDKKKKGRETSYVISR
jgi:hypothetical protein